MLFIAPGNAGTAELGKNISLSPVDFPAIKSFCLSKDINMVIVGPEAPLVHGIYDFFKKDPLLKNIIITGPSKAGAQLEGSKSYAKTFMQKYGIPTAGYRVFQKESFQEGLEYLRQHSLPIVLKADGLAAGKGVVICQTHDEAIVEFEQMIKESKFGEAGSKVVVEEFMEGIELSVFILTDGKNYVLLPEAKDYKKIGLGDTGLNTGGMGAISPVPFATEHFMNKIIQKIIKPTLQGLQNEKLDYKGFIFFGLIKCENEPYVIEYNCRLGDPETEVILPRMHNDLIDLCAAMHDQTLDKVKMVISNNAAMTFVAVSGGYPEKYKKGLPIAFNYLKNPLAIKSLSETGGVMVFHAGTAGGEGEIVTHGGRVLAVSALAGRPGEAAELATEILGQIHFEGMYYRSDIGHEFID